MDRNHLKEQLEKDYQLLKALEDSRRVADDPKYKEKLRLDIEELKKTINQREVELNSSGNQNPIEEFNPVQPQKKAPNLSVFSEIEVQSLKRENGEEFLSLTDLAGFCAYAFPLMRWMYEPVPTEYVGWYFSKIQEFFMFNGHRIPASIGRLAAETEYFFRCAYRLPSFDFQSTLSEIDDYVASKLEGAYEGFMMICTSFGYEDHLSGINLRSISLLSVLIKLREGLSFLLKEASFKEKNISPSDAEQDIIRLLIYIIDFLYKERRARESGESLDLPEGIVLKLCDILDHAFKAHLGVQLPEREDGDVRADFPSFVYRLSDCWKDLQEKKSKAADNTP